MIARAKTPDADCGPAPAPCLLPFGHHRRPGNRKLLLPSKRYLNEPGALQIIPLHQSDHRLEWFEGEPELEESEHYDSFEGMARFLAEWEWGSVSHNYPQRCNQVEYLTAVQWNPHIVALVAIGSEHVGQPAGHSVFDDYRLAMAVLWNGRASCELLHARWGKGFIRGIQKDAERSLEKCLSK